MFAVIFLQLIDVFRPRLANQDGVVLIRHFAQILQHVVHARKFRVVFPLFIRIAELVRPRQHRIITKVRIFEDRIHGIEPEAGDPALVPPAGHIKHRLFDRGIVPVQVGLLRIKIVVVVLAGAGIELPGRATKLRDPVVGRLIRTLAVAPYVPVAVGRGLR